MGKKCSLPLSPLPLSSLRFSSPLPALSPISDPKKKPAFPDHDHAVHRDRVENTTHDVDGRFIGGVLVPAAEETSSGERRGFGDADELQRQRAFRGRGPGVVRARFMRVGCCWCFFVVWKGGTEERVEKREKEKVLFFFLLRSASDDDASEERSFCCLFLLSCFSRSSSLLLRETVRIRALLSNNARQSTPNTHPAAKEKTRRRRPRGEDGTGEKQANDALSSSSSRPRR